jgi:hypothetical protein
LAAAAARRQQAPSELSIDKVRARFASKFESATATTDAQRSEFLDRLAFRLEKRDHPLATFTGQADENTPLIPRIVGTTDEVEALKFGNPTQYRRRRNGDGCSQAADGMTLMLQLTRIEFK